MGNILSNLWNTFVSKVSGVDVPKPVVDPTKTDPIDPNQGDDFKEPEYVEQPVTEGNTAPIEVGNGQPLLPADFNANSADEPAPIITVNTTALVNAISTTVSDVVNMIPTNAPTTPSDREQFLEKTWDKFNAKNKAKVKKKPVIKDKKKK